MSGVHDVASTAGGPTRDFGGISGMDQRHGRWLLISDDRSERAPARLYQARIAFRGGTIGDVRLFAPRPLRDQAGQPFPRPGLGREAVDAEAVRFDPKDGAIIWSSEGDARDGFAPGLRRQSRPGSLSRPITLPPGLIETPNQGPRPNLAFEGLTFGVDGEALWIGLEAPLKQDGPLASRAAGVLVRLSRLGRQGQLVQFAYRTDPISAASTGLRADNGVSEILALDAERLLVLERSGVEVSPGRFSYDVRLYVADLRGATDVADLASLDGAAVTTAAKTLVFDFHAAGQDRNFEAMAWGPRLGGRARTLVLAEDNNFEGDKTRFVTLRLNMPARPACPAG
ncbi:esterase-like activity of phytase family protein [Caulobacter sp. BK020]|uniref:esterase-like activity of phytase family protein n=1 Tax=Caulobacter sp. BK020 TaxID=2512117 RepID=UPI001404F93D|nr:esterase-like activity of phytase family protein [Caulobacter sp. BK020]